MDLIAVITSNKHGFVSADIYIDEVRVGAVTLRHDLFEDCRAGDSALGEWADRPMYEWLLQLGADDFAGVLDDIERTVTYESRRPMKRAA